MSGVQHIEIAADEEGARLERWFAKKFPALPRSALHKFLRKGQIRLDGKRVKAGAMLQAGQIVRVPPLRDAEAAGANSPANNNKAAQDDAKERLQKLILHEDEALLILNKPYGLSVQGGSKMRHHLGRLLAESGEPYAQAKLIHRLDRDTSGLLVLGKTVAAARHLSKQFQQRRVQKNYLALILGVPHPQEGEITAYVKKLWVKPDHSASSCSAPSMVRRVRNSPKPNMKFWRKPDAKQAWSCSDH